ncbi:MAG: prephenate dehydrogenase/arogenate dehydrogenase family protein, partial [Myxococcales bacterium]|nr:prephenate dehydrogenase/arogenate dehydrogenase family protein [Myxococcales bacterium]
AQADVTMISVPMGIAVDTARKVAPRIPEHALLCDINSLKQEICGVFQEQAKCEALGLHPMFGPTVSSMRRQKVVVCPVRPGPLADWMIHELGRLGMDIITATPEHHDKMMAVVQVLVHFHTLVMGGALRRTGVPLSDTLQFTSPIYRLELAVVGRLFAQDPDLYAEIEMANPFGQEVREHFLGSTNALAELLAEGDRQRFVEEFAEVAKYFDGFTDEAMAVSDYIIEKLVERP